MMRVERISWVGWPAATGPKLSFADTYGQKLLGLFIGRIRRKSIGEASAACEIMLRQVCGYSYLGFGQTVMVGFLALDTELVLKGTLRLPSC